MLMQLIFSVYDCISTGMSSGACCCWYVSINLSVITLFSSLESCMGFYFSRILLLLPSLSLVHLSLLLLLLSVFWYVYLRYNFQSGRVDDVSVASHTNRFFLPSHSIRAHPHFLARHMGLNARAIQNGCFVVLVDVVGCRECIVYEQIFWLVFALSVYLRRIVLQIPFDWSSPSALAFGSPIRFSQQYVLFLSSLNLKSLQCTRIEQKTNERAFATQPLYDIPYKIHYTLPIFFFSSSFFSEKTKMV